VKVTGLLYFVAAIALFLILFFGKDKDDLNEKKFARVVPKNYKAANDPSFSNHQDTIYYQQKPFTGYQYLLYPSGDTAFVKPYFAGLEEGLIKKWHPNHQLAEQRYYIAGKKEKIHKAWWPNGKLKFTYEFDNDEFNGVNKEWYESGNLFREFHYEKGYESGSQKMYWINGKIRTNYMIKNNRRYGLLGTKNCINVADSVFIKR
jgi:antitoxin component YwqK of YwqJK toxin-antitoxin module